METFTGDPFLKAHESRKNLEPMKAEDKEEVEEVHWMQSTHSKSTRNLARKSMETQQDKIWSQMLLTDKNIEK